MRAQIAMWSRHKKRDETTSGVIVSDDDDEADFSS